MSLRDYSIEDVIEVLVKSGYTVALIGAGFSSEAGIEIPSPSSPRLWSLYGKYHTLQGFLSNPRDAWKYYTRLIKEILEIKLCPPYKELKQLIRQGFIQSIITTNIDGLFRKFGLNNVIELHGSILKAKCLEGEEIVYWNKPPENIPPKCSDGEHILRPAIVFYGEKISYRQWIRAVVETDMAEALLVIGFSGKIAPSNMLPLIVKRNKGKIIVIDPSPSPVTQIADIWIESSASHTLKQLVKKLCH